MTCVGAEPGEAKRVACFGRFMIDLPPGAEVSGYRSDFMFGRIASERMSFDEQDFRRLMAQRESDIRAGRLGSHYKLTRTLDPEATTKVFVASMTAFGSEMFAIDAHRLVKGNVLFTMNRDPFDPEKIDPGSDYRDQKLAPKGIGWVFLNGVAVQKDGEMTMQHAGKAIYAYGNKKP